MLISEFLPNPLGKDSAGEFIELFNNSQSLQNLSGWKIKDASGKTFTFKNRSVEAGEYTALDYKTTKIILNNNGESLFLYDNEGNLIDEVSYSGTAPEGQSLIRRDNKFVFTSRPTPGAPNVFETSTRDAAGRNSATSKNDLRANTNPSINNYSAIANDKFDSTGIFLGIATALILASFFLFVYKKLNLHKVE